MNRILLDSASEFSA